MKHVILLTLATLVTTSSIAQQSDTQAAQAEVTKKYPALSNPRSALSTNAGSSILANGNFESRLFDNSELVKSSGNNPQFVKPETKSKEVQLDGEHSKSVITVTTKEGGRLELFFHIDKSQKFPVTVLLLGPVGKMLDKPFVVNTAPSDPQAWNMASIDLKSAGSVTLERVLNF
jgi:hypothetical protein